MLRFHSKIFVPASFTFLSLGNFSRISKKNLVPKLLKDGKFTRTGISKTKNKSYQYDLSQPHIINPHLYYDEKNDKIKKRHEYKARKAITNEYPPVSKDTETEHLINNLNDDYLLKKPSGRIMSVILELEKRDTNIIEEYIDPIKTALEKLSRKVFYFNLREFGILVTLSARYIPDNENTWKQYTLNFLRILEKKKYYQENPIESKNREKNLIFIFNNIYKSSLRHNFDIKQIVTDMKDLMMDKIDSLSSLSHTILFLTTLTKNSDNPKQDGKNYLIKLIPKINEQIKNINEKDSIGLIQTMHKCEVSDLTLLKNLESKVIKRLEEEQYPNQVMIHHFCILCQSISHVNGYKSSLFPDFALKYFNLHKDKLISILDIIFLVDAFTKKRIHKMDIYKIIEKKINEKLKGLSVEICNHLLKSAQRKYENFSMTFLGLLASRLDKLYQYGENFQKLNGRKALQLINLMNLVKEHNRTVEFEIYENLIALIENESLKDKTNIEKNKAEQSQIN